MLLTLVASGIVSGGKMFLICYVISIDQVLKVCVTLWVEAPCSNSQLCHIKWSKSLVGIKNI